ncbi:hypothetical protein RAS1_05190 [Phycisphaerae bacterium RAS1]|nr:hypothetical protein RAS1_05190 [Phycisphaerae bacterium RAS1]
MKFFCATFAMVVTSATQAEVFTYECDTPPLSVWEVAGEWCSPLESLKNGLLIHQVDLCPGWPPPGGQFVFYTRSLADFDGAATFFVQWELQTNGDSSEFVGVCPASLSLGSFGPVFYQIVIARDTAKFHRDDGLPNIYISIAPDVPHTYRLELFGADLYTWYIDGMVVASGVPEGAYPSFYPAMNFGTRAWRLPNTTRWNYIRYGTIPLDAAGDYDSDGSVDEFDLSFFVECLLGEGVPSGPGCGFADFDADGDTDCDDWVAFQAHWTGPPAVPPIPPPCAVVGDTNCDGAVNVLDINAFVMALSDPSAYAIQFPNCPMSTADANGDGAIDILDINAFVALLQ